MFSGETANKAFPYGNFSTAAEVDVFAGAMLAGAEGTVGGATDALQDIADNPLVSGLSTPGTSGPSALDSPRVDIPDTVDFEQPIEDS